MVQLATVVALVTSACSVVFASLSHMPAQDQYKTRGGEDERPHQQLRFGKATDYALPRHRFSPLPRKPPLQEAQRRSGQNAVPELQVGCGEGFTEPEKRAGSRRGRRETRGNSFYTPPVQSYALFKPQAFQIRRPYYIPVWGAPGKVPLYFPPQPLLLNPGYPPDNPDRRYLPPSKPQKPTITDRFMEPDDDAPIWDTETQDGATPTTTTQVVPTRRTRRPGQKPATLPPLVHNEVVGNGTFNKLAAAAPTTTTTTPAPPARATALPQDGPSRCVWAIISCCSASSADVSYACFEQLGCSGAFWDKSPCDNEFALAAIDSAMKYYDTPRS